MSTSRSGNSWLANQPLSRKSMLAIGLLLGLFLLTSLVTLYSLRQQDSNRHSAMHTYQVLLELDGVQRAALTGQSGARGYLLTQDVNQRLIFEDASLDLRRRLTVLRRLTLDDALQQSRLDHVEAIATRWQREVADTAIRPLQQLVYADPATATKRAQIQADYMHKRSVRIGDLTAALDQMAAEESQLLAVRNQRLDDTLRSTEIINALAVLLGILLGLSVIRLTSRLVTRPLRRLTDLMGRLANHDHDFEISRLDRRDEIGEIARALQVFRQMAIDVQAQSRMKTQVAAVSQRLQQATTHREFGQWLVSELAPLLRAGVALFYSYDDSRFRLDLLGSYGLRLGHVTADSYLPGEGLVGQCATERKPIILDNVPPNYVHIDSGSGEALPSHVTILPVLYRGCLIGVLELAGFHALSPAQLELLDELLPIAGLTLENLSRSIGTQQLLQQTQEQADELRVSELVMRQQKEVLRENNDALQAKTAELEEQSERLIASEEELRVQAEELQVSNEELREKTERLNRQRYVLEELQQETAEKADELARASQYKSEFLANMSHELRTPLNSLLILSRSLADNDTGNLDAEQIESARIIHDAGTSLLHLINDILDLSKIEAGKMEFVLDELPLADLQRRLQRTFAHVARDKGLDFDVEIEPGLPTILHTDGAKLEQIANNLLGNAFKFTARGTVSVRIGRPDGTIAVPAALQGQALIEIRVSDSGIGIPPEKFQSIFNAFEQVDAGTSRKFGGTGLGLAISRRMAMLLGGDISVRSESGRGSCFCLLLPEIPPVQSHDHVAPAPMQAPAPALARTGSPHLLPDAIADDRGSLQPGQTSILVIEDDAAFARILIDMIHRKGYRALAAGNGESGLQLAREHRPTGILLDVMLPAMDGWTVMDQLKADPVTRTIPVHFISATDDASRGLELGAVGFLTKPVSRESIAAAFERLLHFSEGQPRRLLIVDDEADSRTAVRTMLRADGVLIDEADSAEQALELAAQTHYDCIVLDLGLPGMSGMDLLEHLATAPGGAPPVVVYSGRDLSREENLRLRQYTDSIVVKGARSPERLLDEVSLFLHSIRHAPRRVEAGAAASAGELSGQRVLLVDDDMRNLFALSRVLRGWGLQVSMAQDGQKALKALADDAVPGVVLMDIMMPVMDGYETIRAIRTQPQFATLPIIALTAKAMRGDRELCLEAGASDYLSKPIDIDKLASMLRVWLQP